FRAAQHAVPAPPQVDRLQRRDGDQHRHRQRNDVELDAGDAPHPPNFTCRATGVTMGAPFNRAGSAVHSRTASIAAPVSADGPPMYTICCALPSRSMSACSLMGRSVADCPAGSDGCGVFNGFAFVYFIGRTTSFDGPQPPSGYVILIESIARGRSIGKAAAIDPGGSSSPGSS